MAEGIFIFNYKAIFYKKKYNMTKQQIFIIKPFKLIKNTQELIMKKVKLSYEIGKTLLFSFNNNKAIECLQKTRELDFNNYKAYVYLG